MRAPKNCSSALTAWLGRLAHFVKLRRFRQTLRFDQIAVQLEALDMHERSETQNPSPVNERKSCASSHFTNWADLL